MQILFEASFPGLLSAAAWCYRNKTCPDLMLTPDDPPSLLPAVFVPEEEGIETLFTKHLTALIGTEAAAAILENSLHAWYGDQSDLALQIVQYIKLAMQSRSDPSDRLYESSVAAVMNAAGRVRRQAHHYLGVLRFKQVTESLYLANFKPDARLLTLIMPHFCDRFSDQNFVIRDLRHHEAGLHLCDGRWDVFKLTDMPSEMTNHHWNLPYAAQQEERGLVVKDGLQRDHAAADYAGLWQQYLVSLAIPERKNLKLQKQNLPLKYRHYMSEGL